jgi:hypothetical protein
LEGYAPLNTRKIQMPLGMYATLWLSSFTDLNKMLLKE